MARVPVVDSAGKTWMVDSGDLIDPNEPKGENMIGVTTDGQLYQRVGGQWFRILRCDKVSFNTAIAPYAKDKFQLDFTLGREVHYTD